MNNVEIPSYSLLVNRIRCEFSARNTFHLYRSPIFVCHGNVYCYCLISFHLLVCSIQNVHQKCWINIGLKNQKSININSHVQIYSRPLHGSYSTCTIFTTLPINEYKEGLPSFQRDHLYIIEDVSNKMRRWMPKGQDEKDEKRI